MLTENRSLKSIYLDDNKLNDEAGKELMQALVENDSLELLSLARNNLTHSGILLMFDALAEGHKNRSASLD